MRSIAKILSLLPLCLGVVLLMWGVARYRLPYENDRYFDSRTQVVYHAQTAEAFLVIGIILTLAGLAMGSAPSVSSGAGTRHGPVHEDGFQFAGISFGRVECS